MQSLDLLRCILKTIILFFKTNFSSVHDVYCTQNSSRNFIAAIACSFFYFTKTIYYVYAMRYVTKS